MFLQTIVVPVCRFEMQSGSANIKETFGTAFFINNNGVFLTARHVIESGQQSIKENGGYLGLNVKQNITQTSASNAITEILNIEYAAVPYDIAVGKVNYSYDTWFSITDVNVEVWQEVFTYGYPATILVNKSGSLKINLRVHKGYIQRLIEADDDVMAQDGRNHPNSFETSFLISFGLSGAPLIVPALGAPRSNVIGVCVGNYGTEYKGIKEEVGIVQDIRPLISWRPSILNGKTLAEISS